MLKLLLATSNPHKVEEILSVLEELSGHAIARQLQLLRLDQLPDRITEPVEDASTFEGNALLKARCYSQATGLHCLADDSGLEVDALGGAPGVISARYAGVEGPRSVVDPANNALLLRNLAQVPADQRSARFVCAMALVAPDQPQPLALVRGTVEGCIISADQSPRGSNGFGYDPLFVIPHLGKTTAELSSAEKNALSHRGNAVRLLWPRLQQLLESQS